MKVKVLKDMEHGGKAERRVQVTDCSDINIVIQGFRLCFVRDRPFRRNSEGWNSKFIFNNS